MSTEGRDLIVDLVKTRKMSPLAANPLVMAQISTLQELGAYAPWQLLRLPNFGRKALKAVEQVMLEHGLRLAPDKDPRGGAPAAPRTRSMSVGYEQAWRIYQQLQKASDVHTRSDDEQRDIDLFFGIAMQLREASAK